MAVTGRQVQPSLLPDHAVAPLYLTGSVLDVTYGEGGWWKRFKPDELAAHDLDPAKGDGVDFRALPELDSSVDTVCFDPPYTPAGGLETSTTGYRRPGGKDFRRRYGLNTESTAWADLEALIAAGLTECARVARRWVLVKCMDFVDGGTFRLGHLSVIDHARRLGLGDPWDLIVHHGGSGPGGHNIFDVKRARRHHSYLLVFAKAGAA